MARITLRGAPRGERILGGVLFVDGVADNVPLSDNSRAFFEQPSWNATIEDVEPAPEAVAVIPGEVPVPELAVKPSRRGGRRKAAEEKSETVDPPADTPDKKPSEDVTTVTLEPGTTGDELLGKVLGA